MASRTHLLKGPADVHEVTANATLLLGSNMNVTRTKYEEADPNVRFLDDFENQINNEQIKRQKSRVTLHIVLFSLIVAIIIITSVLFIHNFGSRDSKQEASILTGQTAALSITKGPVQAGSKLTVKNDSAIKMNQFPDGASKELKIMSAQDFKLLEPSHSSVDILRIDEGYEDDFPFLLPIGDNVKNIKISGPITPQWFYFLMRKFPAVLSLTIDLDKLCSAGTFFRNIEDGVIAFEGVEKYVIRNFKRCDSKISDSFLSLNFPSLNQFIIEDSNLTFERYAVLAKFLKSNAKLFHSVTFRRCFICKSCKVFDIEYPSAEVEIFDRRQDL